MDWFVVFGTSVLCDKTSLTQAVTNDVGHKTDNVTADDK